jgi:hypothetical protein
MPAIPSRTSSRHCERDEAAERADRFVLAGKLLTDIPNGETPSEDDNELIARIIHRLGEEAYDAPTEEVGIWRGTRPPDGCCRRFRTTQ